MTPEFPIPENLLYFNSANLSFCPSSVIRAVETHRNNFEFNPTLGLKTAWKKLWQVQSELANFFSARPTDLILRPNVTEVLNAFILGYPSSNGDEILIGELEYGSIFNICRFKAEQNNLSLRVLKIPQSQIALAQLTEDRLLEHIESQFSSKTKILVLSHVIASLGLQIPLKRLAQITRSRDIILMIDGAYAPGAIDVDFSDLEEVDFYGCSLYKWMLGPKGTGFGWVHPKHQSKLQPRPRGRHVQWNECVPQSSFA